MRLWILLVGFFVGSVAQAACPLPSEFRFRRLSQEKNWISQYETNGPILSLPAQITSPLREFQDRVSQQVETDPYELARRQAVFFVSMPEERQKFDLFLSREWGRTSRLACLESSLLPRVWTRFGSDQVEFVALVLERQEPSLRTRVIVYSSGLKKMVLPSPEAQKRVRQALEQGWVLRAHIHNHPFSFENPYGDVAGTLIPSGPDLQSYRMLHRELGLREAWVTNGFHTARYQAKDF